MSIKTLNPYIHFNGTAEKAIRLYEKTLGAKVETIMRWAEMPGGPVAEADKNRVMHGALTLGDTMLMVSDASASRPVEAGENVQVCLHFDDEGELRKRFQALAEGGQVRMAPEDTFWGAVFGVLVDEFGIVWMFNHDKKKDG